ncbi:uncharacterized protein BXIN_0088 [Babesia sp. Xinjiang]|uniref:uncharacterized protein n=1 Tax=Babesia sp. Xinjiang TaxID=462227 RepID=UPI000A2305D4|nr:uncharacterized protein BXIN_0088 [Babesia sp. Xinjiang]ORM39620.1 hypothetical protein BXIN_0088 [Babesia sp. Xinjiang]
MAGRSEKKRILREKSVGFLYTIIALVCLVSATFIYLTTRHTPQQIPVIYDSQALWLIRHVVFPRGGINPDVKTFLWRAALIVVPYGISLASILSSLRLGVQFSVSNDLFCLTTVVCIVSIFVDWAYKLLAIVPIYAFYKLARLIYTWALTPEPEAEVNPKKAEKAKRKFKTIRA